MRKIVFRMMIFGIAATLLLLTGQEGWAKEVPYTLEDRDRLIRIETALREFKESVDKRFEEFQRNVDRRFEQIDKRFEQVDKRFGEVNQRFGELITFMWILGSVLGGLVAVTIGFAVWDRRTALAPAIRRSQRLEEEQGRMLRALQELAQKDPNVAEALRHVGLL